MYIRIGRPFSSTNHTTSPTTPPPVGATKRKRPPPSGSNVMGLSTFAALGVTMTSFWLRSTTCVSPPRPRYRPAKRAHAWSHATATGFNADAFTTATPTVAINSRAMSLGFESFVFVRTITPTLSSSWMSV